MLETDDDLIFLVQDWVQLAETDLRTAVHMSRLRRDPPTGIVCFHAQQCIEKYLKALLVWHDRDFARTHQLAALIALLPPQDRPALTVLEQEQLTDYAVSTRYPGDSEPISLDEAQAVIEIARRVRRQVRSRLPRRARAAS